MFVFVKLEIMCAVFYSLFRCSFIRNFTPYISFSYYFWCIKNTGRYVSINKHIKKFFSSQFTIHFTQPTRFIFSGVCSGFDVYYIKIRPVIADIFTARKIRVEEITRISMFTILTSSI
ncbi:MAG: hypothetical protein EBY80_05710 [Actinobacteria bacterium]|nr:hypothetical protein [Actinomycetota bacterium]